MNDQPKTKWRWRLLRWGLIGLAVIATLIAIFYTEEDWRGKRAWEKCKAELEAKGAVLDWNAYLPPPVPDDQNFFTASTNILLKFKKVQTDAEAKSVSKLNWLRITYSDDSFPVFDTAKSGALVVAELSVLPSNGARLESAKNHLVVDFNSTSARKQVQSLIEATIGRSIQGVAGFQFSEFQLSSLVPAQIFVEADSAPSISDLENFIPADTTANVGHLRIEATVDKNIFHVVLTGVHVTAAADYLKWSDQFEPAFDEIREALKRPYAIIPGDYSQPFLIPIPNFVMIRSVAQTLGQRAQCEFLLGEPDKALRELTLMHDMCRILEKPPVGKPITLVEAMINVAISGLYVSTVADGLRLHAWQEPQLVALQEQLKEINLLPQVAAAYEGERDSSLFHVHQLATIRACRSESDFFGTSTSLLQKLKDPEFDFLTFAPRGWVYQNLVTYAQAMQKGISGLDTKNSQIYPNKGRAAWNEIQSLGKWSPYAFLVFTVSANLTKATQTLAYNQTLVNEAQIACALERYRLAHNEYPETLDALVPQFIEKLPHDIIGGQPLHYRRTEDGKFSLYSVGWNQTDDGGLPGTLADVIKGDWVWQYPTQ